MSSRHAVTNTSQGWSAEQVVRVADHAETDAIHENLEIVKIPSSSAELAVCDTGCVLGLGEATNGLVQKGVTWQEWAGRFLPSELARTITSVSQELSTESEAMQGLWGHRV